MAKLILASGSPRRAELLHQIGAAFEVQVSEAEELRDAATPRALTCANARAKAEAVAATRSAAEMMNFFLMFLFINCSCFVPSKGWMVLFRAVDT